MTDRFFHHVKIDSPSVIDSFVLKYSSTSSVSWLLSYWSWASSDWRILVTFRTTRVLFDRFFDLLSVTAVARFAVLDTWILPGSKSSFTRPTLPYSSGRIGSGCSTLSRVTSNEGGILINFYLSLCREENHRIIVLQRCVKTRSNMMDWKFYQWTHAFRYYCSIRRYECVKPTVFV